MNNNPFNAIFDFSFTKFVSIDLIRLLYLFSFVVAGLIAVSVIFAGSSMGLSWGIGSIILAPVIYFLFIITVRVFSEILVVIFKIAENTQEIADRAK